MVMRKKIFTFIFIILAICQISINIYAYTTEEAKKITDYKELGSGEDPGEYDFLIDLNDIKDDEEIPAFQTSVDTILYGKEDILKVNFFDENNNNSSEFWVKFRNIVLYIYRITLYIAAALMLTLLIYIAIILVSSSITNNEVNMRPLRKLFGKGVKRTPEQEKKRKKIVEQWVIGVIALALLTIVINLTLFMSDEFGNIIYGFKPDNYDICNYIKVYAKYEDGKHRPKTHKKKAKSNNNSETNSDLEDEVKEIINNSGEWAVYCKNLNSGLTVVNINAYTEMPSEDLINLFVAAAYYDRYSEDVNAEIAAEIEKMIEENDKDAVNKLMGEFGLGLGYFQQYLASNGYSSTMMSVTADGGTTATTSAVDVAMLLDKINSGSINGSSKILKSMNNLQNNKYKNYAKIIHKDNLNYILVIQSSNVESDDNANSTIDAISQKISEKIDSNSQSNIVSEVEPNEEEDTTEYTFKTSLEGLMMYQTQYDTSDTVLKAITCLKFIIYGLFLVRMFLIGILISVSPILVIINAYRIISNQKGIYKKYIKLYLYALFFKPFLTLVYFIMVKTNTFSLAEFPFYILFVKFVMILAISTSFGMLIKSMKK